MKQRARPSPGFTIVEYVIAIALIAILATIPNSLIISGTKNYQTNDILSHWFAQSSQAGFIFKQDLDRAIPSTLEIAADGSWLALVKIKMPNLARLNLFEEFELNDSALIKHDWGKHPNGERFANPRTADGQYLLFDLDNRLVVYCYRQGNLYRETPYLNTLYNISLNPAAQILTRNSQHSPCSFAEDKLLLADLVQVEFEIDDISHNKHDYRLLASMLINTNPEKFHSNKVSPYWVQAGVRLFR